MNSATQRIRDSFINTVLVGEGGTKLYVRSLLGEGGQGWVFKADYDEPDGFTVVVKVLRPEGLSADAIERFDRETKVLQMLGSVPTPNPNIVRYYDHGLHRLALSASDPVLPFLALEYVEGTTLATVVDQHVATVGAARGLPVDRASRIMRQVARALHMVHEHRIVHRDLKPSNILLATQHGREIAKITDFGLVKAPGLSARATATIPGATLGYAPPEQYEMGNTRVSAATDIFSFATILFEVLSGRAAFPHTPGESPLKTVARMLTGERPQLATVMSNLPVELRTRLEAVAAIDRELAHATAADPSQRHGSVMELWGAIEPILKHCTSARFDAEDSSTQFRRGVSVPDGRASWRFSIAVPPLARDRVRAGTIDHEGNAYAVGMKGVYRGTRSGWSEIPLPPGLDVRRIRGVAPRGPNDIVLFGEGGLAALLTASHEVRVAPGLDADFNWLGAFTEDGDVVLVGERRSRGAGAIAEIGSQSAHVVTIPNTTRLYAVTRLASGALLACGNHGDLVQVLGNTPRPVGWARSGHLFALARSHNGAFAVGSGGHAIEIRPTSPDQPEFLVHLEVVQTTRDLLAVRVDPAGFAWAAGQSGRLLERRDNVWTRVVVDDGRQGQGVSSNFVAVMPTGRTVLVLAEDGTIYEGWSGG
ncbi:MAG: serine/threonine-protein kinase [Polyangiaceae bacterium]